MSNREEHRDEDQRTTQPQDEDDIHMEIEGQQERDSERPSTLLQMTQGKAKKKGSFLVQVLLRLLLLLLNKNMTVFHHLWK